MALGFAKASSNDFLPSLRFNAVSGDCIVAGATKNADGTSWDKFEHEVKFPAKFVADFENIEIGWILFSAQGPNFALSKIGEPMPDRPSDKHKQGFRLVLFSKEHGLVTFSNSSNTVKDVMDDVHDAYLSGKDKNAGKMPVLEFKGVEKFAVKTKEGSKNYKKPVISIVSWVEKPEGMKAKEAEVASAPAPVVDDDDEF